MLLVVGVAVLSSDPGHDEAVKWATLEALRSKLFGSGQPYLFVDPTMGTPWERSTGNGIEAYREWALDLRVFQLPLPSCPFLVPLRNDIGGFFDWSFELAWEQREEPHRPYPVCAWLNSTESVAELRRHLASRIVRREGGGPWLLRFYDPRVALHMVPFVDGGFRLEGVDNWWFLADTGQLRVLPVAAVDSQKDLPSAAVARLDWLRVINRASADWPVHAPGTAVEHERLYAAAHAAANAGLSPLQEADCIAFILHRCLVHDQLEQHPMVAAWLNDARSDVRSYVDAAASAGPEVWSEIAAGKWQSKSMQEQGDSHG